ncbi:MAG TPA: DUF6600 domain-containing protein [Stellaceae bacterium]|jgi:hypothetical protein|nr:DUF6600 domain-containing protein [Stellaceae bacterium]
MRRAALVLPLSLLLLTPAYAANAADPPARVGRLSYLDGTVSFHPAGQQGDWSPATVNYPVTSGESFWTDANARAAVEVGPAELRLDQASQLDVTRLDDRSTDLQLDQGVLNLHLTRMPSGEIIITTPRGRVLITAPGDYDIDAGQPDNDQPADQLQVAVFNGAAKFQGDRGAIEIPAGQAAVISGDPVDVQFVDANPNDFDQWAEDQEHKEDLAKIPQAVPPAVTGYQDLAAYGSWNNTPDYGQVWYPSDVPADWAPYRYGHWAWVDPWGWTWIDDAPWGFAPFHYGRWVEVDDRWAWVPGDIPPQPVYAPALVTFVGDDGWGVDLAAGAAVAAIGWVALAPHEVYHPWYNASAVYDRGVNGRDWNQRTFNVTNVTVNNFQNRRAATVVPTAAFTHAAPVQRASVSVAADQLARTRAGRAATANLQPSAFSRVGRADPQAATAATPQANVQAHVAQGRVTATTPEALAQQKAPTAPGPHRVAEAAHPIHANAPANAAAAPNATQQQRNVGPNNPARPNAAANAAPQATEAPNAPSGTTRGPAPVWGRGDRQNAPNAPAANANLAPHPVPPNQASREAPRGAPNAPAAPNTPAGRDLAAHPAPPNQASREAPRGAPNAAAPSVPATRDLAQHPAPPQPRGGRGSPEHAATPNAAPNAALAQPQHIPAAPPSRQNAALPPETPRHAPPAHAAAPAPTPQAPPQVAHTPAPMPPRAAPPPHAAAPAPAPRPVAAPAPHPPAAPPPAAAPAPRPAAAPAPHPPAAPPAPAPHPAAAPAPHPPAAPPAPPHPAVPPPAPHPAAAPAAPPHPAPPPAAKAPPQPEKDKKDQPH